MEEADTPFFLVSSCHPMSSQGHVNEMIYEVFPAKRKDRIINMNMGVIIIIMIIYIVHNLPRSRALRKHDNRKINISKTKLR